MQFKSPDKFPEVQIRLYSNVIQLLILSENEKYFHEGQFKIYKTLETEVKW
jgi:hypothetical protein